MDLTNPLLILPPLFIAVALYYIMPDNWRRLYLLLLSLAFLSSITPHAIIFLIIVSFCNFFAGLLIERYPQKIWLRILFISLNVFVLAIPRLFNQFNSTILLPNYFIPLGIAFITLQNIGYILDVSRGILPVENHLINFLLFTCFFAKLPAGPIEPARRFLPQFKHAHPYNVENVRRGLFLISIGIFKKVVIANRLALINDQVFNNPGQYFGLTIVTSVIFYSFQIYFDFSGYTNIAHGLAIMFGYSLSINFDKPFLAENISEFWNHWHMTLTTWLREYVFFPTRRLLLRQHNSISTFMALLIPPILTMLVSGLWHGLKPTFIIWGIYHGILLFLNAMHSKSKKNSLKGSLWGRRLITFGLVTFGWFFFRSASLSDVGIFLKSIFVKSTTFHDLLLTIDAYDMIIAFITIPLIMGLEIYMQDTQKGWNNIPIILRWSVWLGMLLATSMLGVYQPGNTEFIYAGF
jgi:alginate O-acetyltransferase complex protein AlgI